MSATQDEVFMQEIIENRIDDTPRLIYADYLEERGDVRGEFIRLQCEISQTAFYDPRQDELKKREEQLIQSNPHLTGLPSIPALDRTQKQLFRRGFVDGVSLDAKDFVRVGKQLISSLPICEFKISGTRGLEKCAHVKDVRRLAINGIEFGPSVGFGPSEIDIDALTKLPFEKLTSLSLRNSFRIPYNPDAQVRRDDQFIVNAVTSIVDADSLSQVVDLDLSFNTLGSLGTAALVSDNANHWRKLNLNYCSIGDAGLAILCEKPLRNLQWLEMSGSDFSKQGIQKLCETNHFDELAYIDLSGHNFGDESVEVITSHCDFPKLEYLRLSANSLTDYSAEYLAQWPGLQKLKKLELRLNGFTSKGLRQLVSSQYWSDEMVVLIGNNRLTEQETNQLKAEHQTFN